MKNIFDLKDQQEIVARLEKLTSQTPNQWGKMNAAQMLSHCEIGMKAALGEIKTKSAGFPLNIIGKLVKNKALGEAPIRKSTPTAKEYVVKDNKDFETEKENFKKVFTKLTTEGAKTIKTEKHPFFGKMNSEEWSRLSYKHIDHHFKQFGI